MNAKSVIQRTLNAPRNPKRLRTGQWDYSDTQAGTESVMAEYKAEVPISIRPDVALDISIPAYEQLTADGDGAESTYNLSHSLVDDPAGAQDLVLWADGNRVQPDSVDYDGNSFSYTDDGTGQRLDVFYLSDEQAELTLRFSAPRNLYNEPLSLDVGLNHARDTNEDPVTFQPDRSDIKGALEGVAPTDYTLEVRINAPYQVVREADNGATADNLVWELPVWKAQQPIDGLDWLKAEVTG